jgi:anti-sigma factor RsiW
MADEHPDAATLGAFVDGELDEAAAGRVAAHLAHCPACAAEAEAVRRDGARLAAAARLPLPPQLADRVRRALAAEATPGSGPAMTATVAQLRPRPAVGPAPARHAPWRDRFRQEFAALAATAVLAAGLSSAATWWVAGGGPAAPLLAHDLITAHLRALAQDGAIQVASSDSHTVKPWFAGRVDFSPDAPDLAAHGFVLVGGRVDYVEGRRVGAVVYRRNMHLIDVFAWPAAEGEVALPAARAERGYNLVTWRRGGVVYWAVSDLDINELRRLAGLL